MVTHMNFILCLIFTCMCLINNRYVISHPSLFCSILEMSVASFLNWYVDKAAQMRRPVSFTSTPTTPVLLRDIVQLMLNAHVHQVYEVDAKVWQLTNAVAAAH